MTTVESEQQAEDLTQRILEEKLAACIQIHKIRSRYWWNGKIENSDEYLLSIKTRASMFSDLSNFIKQNHPYEIPEIVQIPITGGSDKYLEWMESVV
jgi:periplasmic divalent cation tolerance protein